MILPIKKEGDSVLREPTQEVKDFDFELQKLIDDMIDTMRHYKGVGLAAPQVGVSKKMVVLEYQAEPEDDDFPSFPLTVLCNPKVVKTSDRQCNMVEGCLSIPKRELLIKRPESVTVEGQDRYGNPITIEANSLFARVLQHEIDHLNCTLMVDHLQETKVLFIGTGSLGAYALKQLIADPQYTIVGVVTGDSQALVRGKTEERNYIYQIAKESGLPIIRTEKIRDEKIIAQIKKTKPDLGIMADFGQIVPESILNIPKHGVINIHPSLLPKHRGPSPIQQTILDGDRETGITIMLASKEMDAGPIIAQAVVELSGSETTNILKEYFAEVGGTFLLQTLPYYLAGDLKPSPQDEKRATYTHLFKKEDGQVDEKTSAIEIERKIRAFNHWPKVYTYASKKLKGKSDKADSNRIRVQLLAAHFGPDGSLVIDRVKPEGKKEMGYQDFVNGYRTELTFRP